MKEMIEKNPVMIFTKTTCSYCTMAKRVLNELGASYEEEALDKRDDMNKIQDLFLAITGERTVSKLVEKLPWLNIPYLRH